MKQLRNLVILILLLLAGPLSLVACGEVSVEGDWSQASREAAGIAPDPSGHPEAIVQVYAARAFKWRGAFAVHTWIAVKPAHAPAYTTFEVMGWNLYHGDSAIDIEMRIWICDPQNGVSNIKSAVLLRVWDKFHEHGIEIPFPQRDLHLIPPTEVSVRVRDVSDSPADGQSTGGVAA